MTECAHAKCGCQAGDFRREERAYCSAVCADAVTMGQGESGPCPCPHDSCSGH